MGKTTKAGTESAVMNWIKKWMYGRYGWDQLSGLLLGGCLLFSLLALLQGQTLLAYPALALLLWSGWRCLSRQTERRRVENACFTRLTDSAVRWLRLHRAIRRDKDHCYFRCPNCGQHLRVPRGKGRIQITCRTCGMSFEENS